MDSNSSDSSKETEIRHSPADFANFIPWACAQLQVEETIIILETKQSVYSGFFADKKDHKPGKVKDNSAVTGLEADASKPSIVLEIEIGEKVVNIQTIYDTNNHLLQLKFLKNQSVPRSLLKIISLVIQFYPHLTSITINRGLRCGGLYELSNLIALSKITEVILDDTIILEANYYILIEKINSIKYLSLARCKLNDEAVEALALRLITSPLSILNLTSNGITDVGASYLSKVLRSNRNLTYLNLSGNMITDTGAVNILNCLMEFPLSHDEINEMKLKHIAYLRKKNDVIMKALGEQQSGDFEKKINKRKSIKQVPMTASKKHKGLGRAMSIKSVLPTVSTHVPLSHEKAADAATSSIGPFLNPFSQDNTVIKDGVTFCLGNNVLCYLNLAYNNLTYFSVKKLYDVLCAQEDLRRSPRGLINVSIEGNNLPEGCPELTEIDLILQNGLATIRKMSAVVKKKPLKLNMK